MIAATPSTHVRLDDSGVAWVDDTNVKVVEIILDHQAYGHSPEEIHLQHPHLSLAQVHSAFAYYFDHQSELDGEIERRYRKAQALSAQLGQPITREQLAARSGRQ